MGGLLEPGEVEAAVSCDCATAPQPGWQSDPLSKRQKKKWAHDKINSDSTRSRSVTKSESLLP